MTETLATKLDLSDIQGNIVNGYSRYGYPVARYLFLRLSQEAEGRQFISALASEITTAAAFAQQQEDFRPTTTNIGFTYEGLKALGVSDKTLHSFPEDFSMGMRARVDLLGDNLASGPAYWDPIWQGSAVHIWMSINACDANALEIRYEQIKELIAGFPTIELCQGHRVGSSDRADYQPAAAINDEHGRPTAKEHFGYTDGISNPVFEGQGRSNF